MTTEKKRRKFTLEFKKESVALITEQGYSVAKAAQAVNVSENNIRRWRKELDQVANGEVLAPEELAELVRLRRENKELRMEKEILKKASAFFAKEMK
jgi:transposase